MRGPSGKELLQRLGAGAENSPVNGQLENRTSVQHPQGLHSAHNHTSLESTPSS